MIDFKTPYARENALSFLSRFLPEDFKKIVEENIPLNFKPQFVERVNKLGEAGSLQDLHIYEIVHGSENDPRVGLSRDAFRLLANFGVQQALVFFVSKHSPNYRLSLITLDLKWESGKKVEREYSNPRRYSFFLGPDAKTHTPAQFLVTRGAIKDVEDLISRFDVEVVTKEFFTNYKKLFDSLQKFLEKDHAFTKFAEKNSIDIDSFAKKILGQIVFCYFLQKKGWLGAKKGADINKGDKDFMRTLFTRSAEKKENFYNEYLEPLFYDSLNAAPEEPGDFYRDYFDSQIPFLNGGLFEPLENYDWKKSFLHIPDTLFSNKQGTGILDIFDLYNFTVYEDDPVDREVSVDPEMLGKVFENLLPENIRRGQGAYYTPREIVHYMCQESLINHLTTETDTDEKNIRKLITAKEHLFTSDEGLVFSPAEAEKLDNALADIKICDPACGSGAFLVGILHEIVIARRVLNPKKHEYRIKKEAIQNSIYGVDIDPGAVEIAKLRLWLSLVVDYELEDIEPLPNLDYKIMCGNSLLEELVVGDESIQLFDDRLLHAGKKKFKNALSKKDDMHGGKDSTGDEALQRRLKEKQNEMLVLNNRGQLTSQVKKRLDGEIAEILKELAPKKKTKNLNYAPGLFAEKAEAYFEQLKKLHEQYFSEFSSGKKKQIRKQIEQIELEFIKSSIQEKIDNVEAQMNSLNMNAPDNRVKFATLMKRKLEYSAIPDMVKGSKSKPYFLWKLNYFEVFQEKNGFDLMIANPPYINTNEMKLVSDSYRRIFSTAFGSYDIYVVFLEKAANLLRQNGTMCFITSNKFLIADYGIKLREYLLNEQSILKLIDLADCRRIFEQALVSPCVTLIQKTKAASEYDLKIAILKDDDAKNLQQIKFDIRKSGSICAGKNKIFDIYVTSDKQPLLDKILVNSFSLEHIADVRTGVMGFDYWNMAKFIQDKYFHGSIRIVTNGFVSQYAYSWGEKTKLYKKDFYNPHLDIKRCPLSDQTKELFKNKKIIIRGVAQRLSAHIDNDGYALLVAVHAAILKNENNFDSRYVLGVLNSRLMNWYHLIKFYTARIPEGSLKYPISFLKTLPIKNITRSGFISCCK